MALPYPIAASQTDAKSPVDDNLMDSIRLDLDYFETLFSAGNVIAQWKITGNLALADGYRKPLDGGFSYGSFQPGFARAIMNKSGLSGTLGYDIRKITVPKVPIIEIAHQYSAATQSIARSGSAVNTQSIARATTQVSTQSITHAKAALNILSIINIGGNLWQYNLSGTVDSDYAIGDSFLAASATSGGNNGTFPIVEKNRSGHNCLVILNASGVAQTGAAGTIQLKIMSYNYTNPVNAQFVAGEAFTSASHTTGANNGALIMYAVNNGGNNIWVKNSTGATQAGVAGTADTLRWTYTYSGALTTTDYVVGENALFASHTTGGNNGTFPIRAVNSGGNNLIIYNTAGAVQAGVAGNVNTHRWIYAMPSDPSTDVSVGYVMTMLTHTTAANNGNFTVVQVNRPTSGNTIVIYNEAGVAQAGVAGTVSTARKLVKFTADQSAVFTVTTSYVEIQGCADQSYNMNDGRLPYQVVQVNRGGGSNFNIVIEVTAGAAQINPAGYVQIEMKSIFTVAPTIAVDVTSLEPNQYVSATSTALVSGNIAAGTPLVLIITSMPTGEPTDLTVTLH